MTYPKHLPKEELNQFMITKATPPNKLLHSIISHETGATGYEHTHLVIQYLSPIQTTNPRFFDFPLSTETSVENLHPNIVTIASDTHWRNACRYVEKDDRDAFRYDDAPAETADQQREEHWFEKLRDAETLEAAIRGVDLRSAPAALMVFDRINKRPRLGGNPPTLYGWQAQLVAMPRDPRQITWIYDQEGGCGKSFLARFLNQWHEDEWMTLACAPSQRDLSCLVKAKVDKGWNGNSCLLDLPRAYCLRDMYPTLEDLSNGAFTSVKYVGSTFTTDPLRVVVFANFLPDLDKMSMDRWNIFELYKKDANRANAELRTLTLQEVRSMGDRGVSGRG